MDWPTGIALVLGAWGALLSTWQLWLRRRPRLRLSLSRASAMPVAGIFAELLVIKALNLSERPVRVEYVSLEFHPDDDPTVELTWGEPEGATLPGVVEPHDRGVTTLTFRTNGSHRFPPDIRVRGCVVIPTNRGDKRVRTSWMRGREIPYGPEGRWLPVPRDLAAKREQDADHPANGADQVPGPG